MHLNGNEEKHMKPTTSATAGEKKFPVIDYHYHTSTLDSFDGRCLKRSRSFHDISREYFDGESNRDFLSEAVIYGTLVISAMVPIVSGAFAVIELCRAVAF